MQHLRHWDEVTPRRRAVGEISGASTDMGSATGSVAVGMRRWQVDPGCRSTPPHAHGGEEEIFYVLGGTGLLWQDGQVCEIGAGDCIVHLPDGAAHTLKAGPDGLDVLAFGQRMVLETCYHPHTGRVWAGPTVVAAEGPRDMWELDAQTGPLSWADTGGRPANVVNMKDVAVDEGGEGDCRYANRNLAKAAGSDVTGLRHEVVPAGYIGCPPHCHAAEEEMFVVLDGDGWALLDEEEFAVHPGHVLARPAGTGVSHAFRAGPGGITYLSYGTRETNEICYYPRSNKILFSGVNVMGRIEKLEYFDGEREFAARTFDQ